MANTTPIELQQIRVGFGRNILASNSDSLVTKVDLAKEHARLQANLLSKCPAHMWPKASYRAFCPRPILVTKPHEQQIRELSEALTAAVNNTVERWWSDQQARLFERMPLKREEEDLLLWLEDQVSQGELKEYFACQGSWRPDFLIEDRVSGQNEVVAENFLISEINARFPFNGIFHSAYGQEALDDMNLGRFDLASTTTPSQILNGLRTLFNPSVALHLLIGEEVGMDIHMFIDAARERFGIVPRLIRPSDLRLELSRQEKGRYRLCCLARGTGETEMSPPPRTFINSKGEVVEEIQQVGLELHQHELFALPQDMLRQVSLRCFNDLRTILLVHDKRMLGIIKQELQYLVQAQVLTPYQARALDEGIIDTFIPASPQVHALLQNSKSFPNLKDGYLLKPIRSGKGAGILFGEDLTPHEWESILSSLQAHTPTMEKAYVVQRRVKHRMYDMVLHTSGEKVRYSLVGTWHIIHGKFCGLGIWRSSRDRICATPSRRSQRRPVPSERDLGAMTILKTRPCKPSPGDERVDPETVGDEDIHEISVALKRAYERLLKYHPAKAEQVRQQVTAYWSEHYANEPVDEIAVPASFSSSHNNAQGAQKPKALDRIYDVFDSDELERYLSIKKTGFLAVDRNPIEWWREHKNTFLRLHCFALDRLNMTTDTLEAMQRLQHWLGDDAEATWTAIDAADGAGEVEDAFMDD
ncbi:hypothetical protein NUW58_g1008 [Xylaria curta]|uniref:Uncharacterized protein n=1 Tax=Xylaria curta TaxID=42375 RepID=A0ACC1PQ08_9PEZI|nr:hypothetical protein NUW58_g1008 [Xylaria curta]